MDVDTIDIGLDFVDVINSSLSQCKVLIVVIGKSWLTVADEDGMRRLDNPDDYVRLEIETALQRDVRVVPVLLEGVSIPKSAQLPQTLASLARRNGTTVSHANFGSDTDRLIERLKQIAITR